tara:strand:+ start:369 stop:527 length:159 start_codon:yes stop_codon:yes gene_type:complete
MPLMAVNSPPPWLGRKRKKKKKTSELLQVELETPSLLMPQPPTPNTTFSITD